MATATKVSVTNHPGDQHASTGIDFAICVNMMTTCQAAKDALSSRSPLHNNDLVLVALYCKPMMNKPRPFKGLNIRIPTIIPIKGRGFIRGLAQEFRD